MKRGLIALALTAAPALAAISTNTVWEVRSATGADSNDGGFVPGAGQDMSQQDNKNAPGCTGCYSSTANLSTTDAVTNNSTTVTSATANFTAALAGNLIYLAGSGTVTGWYQVLSVGNATTITLDRATGSTGGSGVTMNIGGALRTLGSIISSTPAIVAGNTVYCDGTFPELLTVAVTGSSTAAISVRGYHTTRGSGQATISAGNARPYCLEINTTTANFWFWENMVFSGGSSWGININGVTPRYWMFKNCKFTGSGSTAAKAISSTTSNPIHNVKYVGSEFTSYAMTTDGLVPATNDSGWFEGCHFYGMTGSRFVLYTSSTSNLQLIRCVFQGNNTGATNGVLRVLAATDVGIRNCTFYNNGGNAINVQDTGCARIVVMNSLFIAGGNRPVVGVAGLANPHGIFLLNNRYYGNGTDNTTPNTFDAGGNAVLSGFPFVSATPLNLGLNLLPGAGADCRGGALGASFPGLSETPAGGLDIGAVQHTDGGGGSQQGYTYVGTNRRPHGDSEGGADWSLATLASAVLMGIAGVAARRG